MIAVNGGDARPPLFPLLVAGAGGSLLLWWSLRRRPDARPVGALPRVGPLGAGWLWPVAVYGTYRPVITDGWGSPRTSLKGTPRLHEGVDLMFPRRSLDDHAADYPPGTPGGSKWFFMPPGISVLAAAAGLVTFAQQTARGHAVRLRHPGGWSTFYQHLADLRVKHGDVVTLGQVLGTVGGDPTQRNPLRHLHFEILGSHGAIDPKPSLLTWQRLAVPPNGPPTRLPPPSHA